jgi:enediyne biosynthesis protein E4
VQAQTKRTSNRNRILFFAGTPLLLLGGGALVVGYVDNLGETFFQNGKSLLVRTGEFSKTLKVRDAAGIEKYFAPQFQGQRLGLNTLKQVELKDGVHRLLLNPDKTTIDHAGAVAEWRAYMDSFSSIDEAGLHIHRFINWRSADDIEAIMRFEVIGTPKGAKYAGIDRAYFRMKFKGAGDSAQITYASLEEGDRYIADELHFLDVSKEAGIDFVNRYYPKFLEQDFKFAMMRYGPAGITAVDYDNDGFCDIFIPDGVESKLFRNLGDGRFEDVTAKAGLAGQDGVGSAVFADYDNDGFKDVFISRTFTPNKLFHNNGNGTFTDVTAKSGIGEDCCTTVASWADYNNDGLLDLYVGRYLDPRKRLPTTFYARNGEPNQLYKNNGDGTFTNVTQEAGVGEIGLCLGTVFGDIDDDGYADLYVVNDFGRKTLYHNNRNGTFTDITVKSGTLAYGAGMSANMADYNNDGKMDIYCTNIRSDEAWYAEWPTVARYMINCWRQGVWVTDMPMYWEIFKQSGTDFTSVFKQMASGNTLLKNRGDLTFEDTTEKAGGNPLGWFWSASFADYDNDGWQDIYMANGWVYNDRDTEIELDFLNNVVTRQKDYKTGIFFDPKHFGRMSWHGWEHKRYLRNRGDGTFEEIGRAANNDIITNARGTAAADYWNRGVMDVAVSASTDKHVLLRNEVGKHRNWLQVELVGTKSNRDAVGARVTAVNKGKLQMREVTLGDGYGSQNSLRQHFGLGDATSVDELTVKWPRSGIVQKFQNVAGNRIVRITEGTNELVEKHYTRPASK